MTGDKDGYRECVKGIHSCFWKIGYIKEQILGSAPAVLPFSFLIYTRAGIAVCFNGTQLQLHIAYQRVKHMAGWPTGHALRIPRVLCEMEEAIFFTRKGEKLLLTAARMSHHMIMSQCSNHFSRRK